ncbi:MAG: phosphotransferase [Bacteroidetes bacterium]|nr:phosphotransferase [Bacteroidota bacterium]
MSYQNEIMTYRFQELFYNYFNKSIEKIERLKADASNRKIYRLISGYTSCIGVLNDNIPENKAFIGFSKGFKKGGLNVPEIYNVSDDCEFYILEDLGNATLFHTQKDSNKRELTILNYYQLALKHLKEFQYKGLDYIDLGLCYETKQFDLQQIKIDEEKFSKHFLTFFDDIGKYSTILNNVFEYINSELILADSEYFMFRDFQPRNIMVKNDDLYFIDYQSGRKGPLQYDLASFLYSGSIDLSEEEREFLFNSYVNDVRYKIDKKSFTEKFKFFVLIRIIQVLGSYGYSYNQKREKKYLSKIEKALNNAKTLLGQFDDKIIDEFIYKLTERKSY